MNLKNKTVVLTGAAGGFGREMSELFCRKGARLVALDRDRAGLADLKKRLQQAGHELRTRALDVSNAGDFAGLSRWLAEENLIPDVWINNAGIAYPCGFMELAPEDFQKTMDVNFSGVVRGTRAALEFMLKRRHGTIVNVASASGLMPAPFLSAYASSKHAVVGFTRCLQLELYQQASAIKLCLVAPGFADTAIMKTNTEFPVPKALKWLVSTPAEVARDIVKAVETGREEIHPGLSAALLLGLYKFAPQRIFRMATRAISARNVRELIGLEGIRAYAAVRPVRKTQSQNGEVTPNRRRSSVA